MRQISKMISILLLLGVASISVGEDIITTKGNRITIPVKSMAQTTVPYQAEESLVYVTCNASSSRGEECMIHLVKLDSAFQVVYPLIHLDDNDSARILQLGLIGNSVLFIMEQRDPQLRVHVLGVIFDLSSNKTSKLALPSDLSLDDQYIGTILDSEKAEVVVSNHAICGELARCKLTFNNIGQQLGEPAPFPGNYLKFRSLPKMSGSMDKGVLVSGLTESYQDPAELAYIDAGGNLTIVNATEGFYGEPLFSNTNDLYGYCLQSVKSDRYECEQFDWRTKSKVAVTNFTPYDVAVKSMIPKVVSFANLKESKFLFVILDCEPHAGRECKTARAVTVDSHDRSLKSIQIFNNLECIDTRQFLTTPTTEFGNKLRIHVECYHSHTLEYIHLYTKSFPESTFYN